MSTNISKQKREELLREIGEIRNKLKENVDENTNQLLVYLSNIEKDVDGKRYGLVFEEHKETVDEILENNVPVLVEDESLKIDKGGTQNFLIEGDNLASLKLLEKTHKGKIDLIYIDPPYNTGNSFNYDDLVIDDCDNFKHSKWLSSLKERLSIAHRLLTNEGLIWISIDENELFGLKFLLDDIFSENNFRSLITVVSNPGGRDYGGIAKTTEYMLVYAKTESSIISKVSDECHIFEMQDNLGPFELRELRNRNTKFNDGNRPNLCYPFYVDPLQEDEFGLYSISLEPSEQFCVKVMPLKSQGIQTVWRWGKEERSRKNLNINIKAKKKKDDTFMIVEKYRDEKIMIKNLLSDKKYRTENGSLQLKDVFGDKVFDYPKPLEIPSLCVQTCSKKNPTILDFFAGSGTTGHAVMKLNNEDGGERKFILCTNNENNICRDVTYERIKRVIEKENYKASLKYLKVGFEPITDKVYYEYADKLLLHIKELVELENGLDFENNKKVAIALTDEELTNIVNRLEDKITYKAIYVGHDVFVSPETEEKLKVLEIIINRIPDYYYSELRG